MAEAAIEAEEKVLELKRVFNAPRNRTWAAWTEPGLFEMWFGPEGFTVPYCSIDLRPGGKYLYSLRNPGGRDTRATGTYLKVDAPRRLVMTDSFADEKGNVVGSGYYGMEGLPQELKVSVELEDAGGRTAMSLRHEGVPKGEISSQMSECWIESFEKLAAVAEGKAIISKSVGINSSRERVWRALLDPGSIAMWGSVFSHGTYAEGEFKSGGTVYFKDSDDNGMKGIITEYREPELIKIEYMSAIKKGFEKNSGAEAEAWRGCFDIYRVSGSEGNLSLRVESKIPSDHFKSFTVLWERALWRIKALAEVKKPGRQG